VKLLRCYLDDLSARGIRAIVLLAPVHRRAYEFYGARGSCREDRTRTEMASRKIIVAGSYSPTAWHAGEAEFYDDVHPLPAFCGGSWRRRE